MAIETERDRAFYSRLLAAAKRGEKRTARGVIEAMQVLGDGADLSLLDVFDLDGFVASLNWQGVARVLGARGRIAKAGSYTTFVTTDWTKGIAEVFHTGTSLAQAAMPQNLLMPKFTASLLITNEMAVEYAQDLAGELITGMEYGALVTTRALVSTALDVGRAPSVLAKELGNVWGLNERQLHSAYVYNEGLKQYAATGSTGIPLTAPGRVLSPQRLPAPSRLDIARRAALVMRYEERMQRYRGMMIARTETMRAANAGAFAQWMRSADEGIFDSGQAVHVWIATPDDRVCDRCAPMNGKVAALGGSFVSDERGFAGSLKPAPQEFTQLPPLHPQCRCITILEPEGVKLEPGQTRVRDVPEDLRQRSGSRPSMATAKPASKPSTPKVKQPAAKKATKKPTAKKTPAKKPAAKKASTPKVAAPKPPPAPAPAPTPTPAAPRTARASTPRAPRVAEPRPTTATGSDPLGTPLPGTRSVDDVLRIIDDAPESGHSLALDGDGLEGVTMRLTEWDHPDYGRVVELSGKLTDDTARLIERLARNGDEGWTRIDSAAIPKKQGGSILSDPAVQHKDLHMLVRRESWGELRVFVDDSNWGEHFAWDGRIQVFVQRSEMSAQRVYDVLQTLHVEPRYVTAADVERYATRAILRKYSSRTEYETVDDLSESRVRAILNVAEREGITPQSMTLEADPVTGRYALHLTEEAAKRLATNTDVDAFIHQWSGTVEDMADALAGPQRGLLSTTTRWAEGVGRSGVSSTEDIATGGADYVFTRQYSKDAVARLTRNQPYRPQFVFDGSKSLRRFDWESYPTDTWGTVNPGSYRFSSIHMSSRDGLAAEVSYGAAQETTFKARLGFENLRTIIMRDDDARNELLRALADRGLTELNGTPIGDIIRVAGR